MKKNNLLKGFTLTEVAAINFVLEHFYYGKDLKKKWVRKHYKKIFKALKKDVTDYVSHHTLKPRNK